jgi:hypothetical protein
MRVSAELPEVVSVDGSEIRKKWRGHVICAADSSALDLLTSPNM